MIPKGYVVFAVPPEFVMTVYVAAIGDIVDMLTTIDFKCTMVWGNLEKTSSSDLHHKQKEIHPGNMHKT